MTLILINDSLVVEKSWYGSWIYYYYAISAHHQQRLEFESRSGKVYSIQHYVIKFVTDLRQIGRFHRVLWGFPPNRHDIAEVLLKVVLNTIPPTV